MSNIAPSNAASSASSTLVPSRDFGLGCRAKSGLTASTQLDDLHLPLAEPPRAVLGNHNGIAKLSRASALQPESRLHVEDHARLQHDLPYRASRTAARQSAEPAGMDHQGSRLVASRPQPLVATRADFLHQFARRDRRNHLLARAHA